MGRKARFLTAILSQLNPTQNPTILTDYDTCEIKAKKFKTCLSNPLKSH